MSNTHHTYSHPGPSYYHPPPGPHYPYGPAPGAPYYAYPMTHMNGHSPPPPPPPPHQPASPRMNGSGRGGYNAHRAGGPSYQHFPHMPHPHHQPYLQPQPMSPAPVTPTSPYSHPQKYSPHMHHMPYTPPYNPPAAVYSPAWIPPTLSPLPKQLSMPAQLSHPPPPGNDSVRMPVPEAQSQSQEPHQPEASSSEPPLPEPVSAPSPPPAPPTEHPEPPPPKPVFADTDRSPTPQSPASTSSRISQGSAPKSNFVVWSRKPRDPSRAQGVMISSRAHPPEDMLQQALDIRTPPQSPRVAPVKIAVPVPSLPSDQLARESDSTDVSSDSVEVPSSSATEATTGSTGPATPIAGSPSTTNTSVLGASPVQQTKPLDPPAVSSADAAEEVTPAHTDAQPTPQAETPAAAEISKPETAVASSPATPPAPAKPAANAPKKSWASLLQPADATASSSKSRLPTSSVVGFSIPAGLPGGASPSGAAAASGSGVRPEVVNLINAGPTGPAPPPKIRPRGLVNTGNMCFANAVLQVLVYCPPFHRLFTELGKYLPGPAPHAPGANATPLVDAIIQFMKEFGVKESEKREGKAKGKEREEDFDELDSFIPTYVYDAMKEKKRFASMVTGHQEDAEEFLGFFLDTLEEELLSISSSLAPKVASKEDEAPSADNGWMEVGKKNRSMTTRATKSAESPITRIFGGKFRSTLKAPHQRDSVTVEDWLSLRLDIQREQIHTIKEALQGISLPHSVEITSPTRPGQVIEAHRQELIETLPPVLILHLKRFLYDTSVGDVVKIGKPVSFGPELEITPDLIAPARRPTHPVKYQLFGALYHHGQSASGGHYTLDVLHPNRELNDRPRQAWIRIDDELVSDVRPDDVFGVPERDDRCAYLLFYRRLGPGVPSTKPWAQLAK